MSPDNTLPPNTPDAPQNPPNPEDMFKQLQDPERGHAAFMALGGVFYGMDSADLVSVMIFSLRQAALGQESPQRALEFLKFARENFTKNLDSSIDALSEAIQ